jgi:2-C-methyl-D-erythritol 4-phosphate cytidylyltransferase
VPVAAIVLAGGRGSRVRSGVNKVFLPVRDRTVVEYSVRTLHREPRIDRIVVAVRPEDRYRLDHLTSAPGFDTLTLVAGGSTRHLSEVAAIEYLAGAIEAGTIDLVAIHDGARPFLTFELLGACIEAADRFGGAVPGLPPEAPLYHIGETGVRALGEAAIRVQTPQVFKARPLLEAYRASVAAGFEGVDTAETIERFSTLDVAVVPGDPRNIKITFVDDLFRAEEMAETWDEGRWA